MTINGEYRSRYVLEQRAAGHTYIEIAEHLGLSAARVRQVWLQANAKNLGNTPEWFYQHERFRTDQPVQR